MNVLVVINPISGGGCGLRRLPALLDRLKQRGVKATVFETASAGDARRAASELDGSIDTIVTIGGDGTVNEVLNGLEQIDAVALGVLPSGTANILARELQLPFNPVRAAEMIADARTRRFDIGLAEDASGVRRFVMCVGVGWDAEVLRHLEAARNGPISRASYLRPIATATFSYDFPDIHVRINDREMPPANLVFIGNGRNYAAFFSVTPRARYDDGELDITLIRSRRRRDILRWFAGALSGRLPDYSEVSMYRGRKIEIATENPVAFQVDGDSAGETPVTVRILPGAARLLVEERNEHG